MQSTPLTTITLPFRAIIGRPIAQAIEDACARDDTLASGVFATSGPGPGIKKQDGPIDFARRALKGGVAGYIDSKDGRLATLDEDGDVVWTEHSEVCIDLPGGGGENPNPNALEDLVSAHRESVDQVLAAIDRGQVREGQGDWITLRSLVGKPLWEQLDRAIAAGARGECDAALRAAGIARRIKGTPDLKLELASTDISACNAGDGILWAVRSFVLHVIDENAVYEIDSARWDNAGIGFFSTGRDHPSHKEGWNVTVADDDPDCWTRKSAKNEALRVVVAEVLGIAESQCTALPEIRKPLQPNEVPEAEMQ